MKEKKTENEDFFYIAENKNCTTVWRHCAPNSPCAERFYVPGYEGVLPFLMPGNGDEALKIELDEKLLLRGILYGLYEFDHHSKPWHLKKDRETLLYLLDYLQQGFRYENREEMVLTVAAQVREELGDVTSRIILEVGNVLIPQSSKIKSDLVFDLWDVICKSDGNDTLLTAVVNLVLQIDFSEIKSSAKEVVCFYGLCALVFLNDMDGFERYSQAGIAANVTNTNLLEAMENLLKNPQSVTPEDLRVVS